ncbi:MAG: DUF1304 domain-containing protein [Parvularcula sp.]
MRFFALFFVLLVALAHIGFAVLEMVYWTAPVGQEIFGTTAAFAQESAVLAKNQGLYNLFLATGLLWGLFGGKKDVVIFFLLCVIAAGIFGAVTAKPSIFFVQAVPALVGLLFFVPTRKSH